MGRRLHHAADAADRIDRFDWGHRSWNDAETHLDATGPRCDPGADREATRAHDEAFWRAVMTRAVDSTVAADWVEHVATAMGGNLRLQVRFQRTLGDKEGVVRFLARVLDDGLHVGFMQRPPAGTTAPPDGSSRVINFVAKRASARVHP